MLQLVKTPVTEGIVHPGDVLEGRYRIISLLGDGGMGTVFLAEHVLIQRRAAIKVLHPDLARDAEVVERFMNEARAAGTLGHPNIVESTDMGFARNDVPYIVFEYLEGSLLSDEIYRLGGLSVRRAVKIAMQVASALEAAHRANIIHRDLKSDNVFLTDKDDALDHVKVLDFGISRFLEAEKDRTGRGNKRGPMLMGTPEFMAPEQIMSPDRVDARTDVYALGVLIYEMLAARTPFLNENKHDPHELLHRIVLDRPPPLAREDLPAGFADMMFDKLLAKEPDARYQTMGDVHAALEAFASVMRRDTAPVIPAVAEPVALPPVAPPPRPARRWPLLVGALVIAAGGAGAFALGSRTAPAAATATSSVADPAAREREALQQRAAQLDAFASALLLRAEGVATSPMLRAAIETDAATLGDMARDGAVFRPSAGESLEVFQEPTTSLLRLPANAAALPKLPAKTVALVARGDGFVLVASAPVLEQRGAVGGTVSLAAAVDGSLAGAVSLSKIVQSHQEKK